MALQTNTTRARGTLRCPKAPEPRRFAASRPTPTCVKQRRESGSFLSGEGGTVQIMGGIIIFLLALIIVAQVAKTAGRRKAISTKRDDQLAQASVAEEEERRQAWIQHYIAEGNYAEARALGWEGTQGLPEWKQYEMQQQAAQEAAIPTMIWTVPPSPLRNEPLSPSLFDARLGSDVMPQTAVVREPWDTSGSHGHGSYSSAVPSPSASGHPKYSS